uniref:Reverse transcriptase domain-containing protein n=1 Tax=Tanacetum cinerariifolium TaxID=118510 RepID=A0A6L2L5J4_TANCI|nr:reverse transcriptase domain-containing protein [Tanacetum cinerariifolium]
MAKKDEEKTTFHTDEGVFCYTKMTFGLQNVRETYQRLVDTIFEWQMGRNLEAYVDDMDIKSKTKLEMIKDVEETLLTLKKSKSGKNKGCSKHAITKQPEINATAKRQTCCLLRYRCARTELITPDLACPLTHQLLHNSGGDSGPDLSFDESASLEHLFSLARVSLAESSKPDLSFGWSGGDYTSSSLEEWVLFIDQRAIPDAMVWRHPKTTIDDPRPAAGSFNMVDVRHLNARVIKIRDMPKSVLVLSGLSRICKSRVCDPKEPHLDVRSTLQRLPFYCTPPVAVDVVIPDPTQSILSLIPLVPRLFLRLKLLKSERPLLLLPLRAMLLSALGNQGRISATPTAKDSRGKGVMADDAVALSVSASRLRPSSRPAPSFRNVFGDAIHTDFFPFSASPYYATYPEDGVAGNCEFTREEWDASYLPTFGVLAKEVFKDPTVYKTIVDQFPTPREMVRVESLSDDQLAVKMSVLHCMMMSCGGELELISAWSESFLLLMSLAKFKLEPKKLVRPANVPDSREVRVSPPTKESTVTLASKSLELSANLNFTAFVVAPEHNEEMVNAKVDGSDPKMTDDTVAVKVGACFLRPNNVVVALSCGEKGDGLDPSFAAGAWYAKKHVLLRAWGKLTVDVWLFIKRILSHATYPRPNGFPHRTCSIAGQASVDSMG